MVLDAKGGSLQRRQDKNDEDDTCFSYHDCVL